MVFFIFFCQRLKRGHRGRYRSVLPRELWEKIYKRLPTSDRIRFASVSNNCLSIASTKPPPPPVLDPWLMFRGPNKFWSLLQKRFYRFDNIIPPKKDYKILGASDGWVLTEHHGPEFEAQKQLTLVNPISNAKIILPPIEYKRIQYMKKLLVVTFGDLVAPAGVFIRTRGNYLIACTCDNRPWRDYPGGYSDDVLFYNGKMYSMMIRTSNTVAITVRSLNEQLNHRREDTYVVQDMGNLRRSGVLEVYLVESCGDLLLVKRLWQRTFEIFKLLFAVDEDSSTRCVKLESLEGQALFWGRDGCISLRVGKFSLFEDNHIYFSVQGQDLSHKIGAYSLQDKRLKEMQNLPQISFQQESTWFFPKIKDTFVNWDAVMGTKSLR